MIKRENLDTMTLAELNGELNSLTRALNYYTELSASLVVTGNTTLSDIQFLGGTVFLTGSPAGAYTLTLPVTTDLTRRASVDLPLDGTYQYKLNVVNSSTQTATLTSGDAGTVIEGGSAVEAGSIQEYLVTLVSGLAVNIKNLGIKRIDSTTRVQTPNLIATGGSINGTTMGATTPSTGSFTTLSTTGNTTVGDTSGDQLTVNATTLLGAPLTANSSATFNDNVVVGNASTDALTVNSTASFQAPVTVAGSVDLGTTGANAVNVRGNLQAAGLAGLRGETLKSGGPSATPYWAAVPDDQVSSTAPTTRSNGQALQEGDRYWDSLANKLFVRDSALNAWVEIAGGGGGTSLPTVVSETAVSLTTTTTANDAAFTLFPDQACTELVFENTTGAAMEYQRNAAGLPILVRPNQRRRLVGITNANQIGVRRADNAVANVSRPTVVTARAITNTETFTVAGIIHRDITSGGGNTQVGSLACTSIEIINTTGKVIIWRIGTTAAYQRLRDGESVAVFGITNADQIYIRPFDSVASLVRPVQFEAFTSGLRNALNASTQAQQVSGDARIQMDDVNYPGQWGTPAWLSVCEQNETRRTLRKKGAVALALFPTVATSTLSQAGACLDATNGELLFGTSSVEYTQSVSNSVALFAGQSELPLGLNVLKSDIHFDYSFPDNNGTNYGTTGNLALFELELHSAGSPAAPTANFHKVTVSAFATNFVRVDTRTGGVIVSNSVPSSSFIAVGTGASLSSVTWARIRLQGGNGSAANGCRFRPHAVWAVPKARTKATVVFLFDDLHISQYTNALPMLAKYNYPACIGLDTTTKAGQSNFITPVQLRNLHQRHGWQIIGQVQGGNGLGTTTDFRISEEHAITQAARYKAAMKMLGISDIEDYSRGSSSFNSDGGPFYPNWPVVKRLFRTNVEFIGGSNSNPPMSLGETVPFGDPYSVKRLNMSGFTAGTWAQRWQEHVDQAVANSGVAIFGAHSEFNTGGEGLTALATLIEYIRTLELQGKVEVLTLARLIDSAYDVAVSAVDDGTLRVLPVPTAITVTNVESGYVLELSENAIVTVPSGLSAGFNFTATLPATGNVTITPTGGVLINGSTSPVVRSATNFTIALIPTSTPNSYRLTGV